MFINDLFKDNEKPLNEVSNELLGRYKKAAGADASAADKRGDIERGNKRFKGIVKATVKQGENDVKRHKEQGVAEGSSILDILDVPEKVIRTAQDAARGMPTGTVPDSKTDLANTAAKVGKQVIDTAKDAARGMPTGTSPKPQKEKGVDKDVQEAYDTSEGNREYFDDIQEWAQAVLDFGGEVVKARGVYVAHGWEGEAGEFDPVAGEGWLVSKVMREGAETSGNKVSYNGRVIGHIATDLDGDPMGVVYDGENRPYEIYGYNDLDELKNEMIHVYMERVQRGVAEGSETHKYEVVVKGHKRSYSVWVDAKNEEVAIIRAQQYVAREHNDTAKRAAVVDMKKGVAEGISVVDSNYDLDQMVLTLDIEGTKKYFTYWDYDENFANAERKDVFAQLQEQPWYAGLDHPTKMEILDAAYKAIRGEEPSEYRPTVGDEPLDEAGPFSYGAKKPRKGSVADLAAKKRKEQERGQRPIEPRDQMVGVAKILPKDVSEGKEDLSKYSTERLKAYVEKVSGGGVPAFGSGAQLKRVQAELKRREQGVSEASVQDKLHRRHQELRKKSGLPNPDYYKELQKSYDIENDQERLAAQADIKKKYKVAEARKAEQNFDIEDIKNLESIRDLATLKLQAFNLISRPSAKPMKPEKVEWFKQRLEDLKSPMAVIKLMYDLLLSGEGHSVIGSRHSMKANTYRDRFGESSDGSVKYEFDLGNGKKDYNIEKPGKAGDKVEPDTSRAEAKYKLNNPLRKVKSVKVVDKPQEDKSQVKNEDIEKYVEELERAGYEIITEKKIKQRLDPKCWKGYKKSGTKIKGGVRVNNCVPKK